MRSSVRGLRQVLTSAPTILEALLAGVSVCGRVRPPSRCSVSNRSAHPPRRNPWKHCIVFASSFLARREGFSCGSGGGGARETPPSESVSPHVYRAERLLEGLRDVPLRESVSSSSSLLLHVSLASSSVNLISEGTPPWSPSSAGRRSSVLGHSTCVARWVWGQICCGGVDTSCPAGVR